MNEEKGIVWPDCIAASPPPPPCSLPQPSTPVQTQSPAWIGEGAVRGAGSCASGSLEVCLHQSRRRHLCWAIRSQHCLSGLLFPSETAGEADGATTHV